MSANIINRITKVIEVKGYSVRAFEKLIGASNGSYGKAVANNIYISSKWLGAVLFHFKDINAEWLMRGKGPMISKEKEKKKRK